MEGGQDQQGAAVVGSPLATSEAPPTQDQQNTSPTSTIADSVNSTNVIESLKGRIIATNKLLKLVETTKSKTDHDKVRISNLTKQLDNYMAENTKLQTQISTIEATKKELERKLTQASGNDFKSKSMALQRDLEQALEQKKQKESLLSSREMYTKQLEAQLEDLESQLSARNKESKKKDDASVLLEKKDKQIKDLKEQLDSALKEQELADEEKLALGVDNEFLQRDHDELKEELEQLKKKQQEQIAAFTTQQQQLEQTRQQLRVQPQITKIPDTTHDTNNEEVEAVRLKLRQSYARMRQLEDQVALLSKTNQSNQMVQRPSFSANNPDYADLLVEFRKCLAENETMKREKRVLQDKLTEQLLINDEIQTSRRNAILNQHGINPPTFMDNQDLRSPVTDFEEIEYPSRPSTRLTLERRSSQPQPRSPLDEMMSDPFSPVQPSITDVPNRRSSHNTQEQPVLTRGSSYQHSSQQIIPEQSPSLRLKQRTSAIAPTITPDRPLPKTRRPLDTIDSRPALGANGLLIPEPRIERSASQTRKPKLTALEKRIGVRRPQGFGTSLNTTTAKDKRKATETPASISTTKTTELRKKRTVADISTDVDSDTSSTDSDLGSFMLSLSELAAGKQRKLSKKTSSRPIQTPEEFIKSQAEQFAHVLPADSQPLLDGLKSSVESHLDLFLATLELVYQRMRTHGLWGPKSDPGIMENIDANGITLEGCPRCIDLKEKNMAWLLWALISQNQKGDLYSKIVKWASESTLKFMAQAKTNLACRYIRLFMLLCKNAKDKPRVSVFCFDMVRWSPRHANIIPPVVNMALIWSDILYLDDGSIQTAGTNMIVKSVQRACAHYCLSNDSPDSVKTGYNYMTRLARWPDLYQAKTLQDYTQELKAVLTLPDFKLLYNANRDAFNDLRVNLVKAFELSYWRLDDWTASYDGFITKDLWNLMSDEVLSHVSLELMGVLARCGPSSGPENTGITALRETFTTILKVGNNCPDDEFPLQIIAAKCLIMISRDTPANFKPIVLWHNQLKSSFVEKLGVEFDEGIKRLRPLSM